MIRTARAVGLMLVMAAVPVQAAKKPPKQAPAAAPAAPSVRGGVDLWRAGDYAGAVAMWQPFAQAGDKDALFNIGQAYKLGRALPKDPVQARDYYRRAAMQGHLPAQANLGISLFQAGEKAEAIKWLKAAADKNEMRAQYVLGVAMWNGDGVPRSLTLAYAYLARASALGLPEATTALNTLTGTISPLERANGWAVATSIQNGNGVPPEFAGGQRMAVASTEALSRDQVIKALPGPAVKPVEVAKPVEPVAVAQTVPAASPPALIARPPAAVATVVKPATVPPAAVVTQPRPIETAQAQLPEVTRPVVVAQAKPGIGRSADAPVTTVAIPPAEAPKVVAKAAEPVVRAAEPVKLAVATPKAVPVPKAEPKKPDGWRVQLGAFSKKTMAETAWADVKVKQKQLIGSRKPIFLADGNVTKLQLGPFANKDAARDACAKIAFSGRACFVTQG